MKIVNFEQGSEEWKTWRHSKLGASNAAAIMGTSPYDDIVTLWEKYTGKRAAQQDNFAMARGRELEPVARRMYEEKTSRRFLPTCCESTELSFMSASLDGYDSENNCAIEIKCPGRESHEMAAQGMVPEHYMAQLQHQMFVADLGYIDYVSFNGTDSLHVVNVLRDDKFLETYLAKAKHFWECVQMGHCPVENYYEMESMLLDYDIIRGKITLLEEQAKRHLDKVSEMVKEPIRCCGFSLSWAERKGSVDYAKVPNLDGVNLDMYRKPPTKYFSVRRTGK